MFWFGIPTDRIGNRIRGIPAQRSFSNAYDDYPSIGRSLPVCALPELASSALQPCVVHVHVCITRALCHAGTLHIKACLSRLCPQGFDCGIFEVVACSVQVSNVCGCVDV